MKVWQNPGETGKAEWTSLSDEKDWKTQGGAWGKADPANGSACFFIVLHSTEEGRFDSDHPFYSHARHIDFSRLTLPEAKDLLRRAWREGGLPPARIDVSRALAAMFGVGWRWTLLRAASQRGAGLVVGRSGGNTALSSRTGAKRLVETFLSDRELDEALGEGENEQAPEGGVSVSVHHRRWERLREKDPIEFMAGFLSGVQRSDAVGETDIFSAGWRHGWEYAVGRAPLPLWFAASENTYQEGG